MGMGTPDGEQSALWVATAELPKSSGHPFYARLNVVLDAHGFDRFVEQLCRRFLCVGHGPTEPAAWSLLSVAAA
jgi:hypothetical protein